MPNIKIFDQIDAIGLEILKDNDYNITDKDYCAILLRSHKLDIDELCPTTELIVRAGAGTNNIPVDELTIKGIPVLNTPGANANAVKELTLAALLISQRNLISGNEFAQQAQRQNIAAKQIEAAKKQFTGSEICGKTLGIIGLGSIGVLVANAAVNLGLKVIGFDPHISIQHSWQLSAKVKHADSIQDCVGAADFISLHLPLLEDTRSFVNAEFIKQIKPGASLLNFARSELVDNEALESALRSKHIEHYCCDFPDQRWTDLATVVSFPHLGASTVEATSNCARIAAEQIIDYISTGSIKHSVNFPSMNLGPVAIARITIANDNVPGVVSKISDSVAQLGLNIEQLQNKSRADIAYTVIDTDSKLNPQQLQTIKSIQGIRNFRYLEAEHAK